MLFCSLYVTTGSGTKAAAKAGYKRNPDIVAEKLLGNSEILDHIDKIASSRMRTAKVRMICGLEMLAFGGIGDALRLVLSADPEDVNLDELDLCNVTEFKKTKDGTIECKFADRVKALEKLGVVCEDNSQVAIPFYKALEQSSLALRKSQGDDE